ncbi:PAS domain S-box-containing protein [Methanolobus profundi]|uniref:histidine kinase n=1 Tax=Methanolobus profundi TaxID=487685 RepID=A0A1I4PDD2_9EURY|nr:PAS domain S-box-containing protein [Methanolobus profundi]
MVYGIFVYLCTLLHIDLCIATKSININNIYCNNILVEILERGVAINLEEKRSILEKRERELECIYSISDLFDLHVPLKSLLKGIMQRLQPAFLYSEVAEVCIVLDGDIYSTDRFEKNIHTLSSNIAVHGHKRGSIHISYSEERPYHDIGPFLKEEQRLLDVITSRLCKVIERKHVEEALLESEKRYRMIFDVSPLGIFVDNKGTISHCNRGFLNIFGVQKADVVGAEIFDYVNDEDLNRILAGISKDTNAFYENEYSARTAGREIHLKSYYVPLRNKDNSIYGGIGLLADITANKNSEEELENQKELLTSTFNALQDLIIVVDREMRVVTSNWNSDQIIPPQEGDQHPQMCDLFTHDLFPHDTCPVKDVFSTGRMKEFEHTDPVDDRVRDFRIFPVYDTKGDVAMAVSHIRDITERKQTEEALKRSTSDLELAYEELKSLDKLKDEFLSNLRHELNTPLTSIKGFSELLYDGTLGPLNDKQANAIERVVTKSRKLQNLIDSLLFISTNQNGNIRYNFEPVDISSVLNNAVNLFFDPMKEKNLRIHVDHTFDSCSVDADRTYLPQIFLNLMDNAVKFTPANGTITVSAHIEAEGIHVVIGDTGIGISEEDIPGLFKMFHQIDSSSTRTYGGNGLGLYISKVIVENHKGDIWIESEKGTGTDVHVYIPMKQDQFSASSSSPSVSCERPMPR